MLPEIELLQYIHKTADMGCEGIETVLGHASEPLKSTLFQQQSEYQNLRSQAAEMIQAQGEKASGAGMAAQASARVMTEGKLALDSSPSKIAEMTIQGTTMGVTKTLRHLNDYQGENQTVRALGERLLRAQEANIEQMKDFL